MMDNIQLPKLYQEKFNALTEALKNVSKIQQIRKLYNDFVKKYTAIPSIWIHWRRCEISQLYYTSVCKEFISKLNKTALSHFYDDIFLNEIDHYIKELKKTSTLPKFNRMFSKVITYPYIRDHSSAARLKNKEEYLKQLENALMFPHRHLESVYHFYSEHSESPVSSEITKIYMKNYNLYEKLKASFETSNFEQWLELLLETGDDDIVIQNMEYYIANKPCQKNAWKVYIIYLEGINLKAMLGVYSRYCRFFLEDQIVKKEYQERVMNMHNLGNNVIKWIIDLMDIGCFDDFMDEQNFVKIQNPFKMADNTMDEFQKSIMQLKNYQKKMERTPKIKCLYEIWFMKKKWKFLFTFDISIFSNDDDLGKSLAILFNNMSEPEKEQTKCEIKWNNINVKKQQFAFCADIINFISKNYECRQKLYQTCKYFFAKFQLPLCHSLAIKKEDENITEYRNNSLYISTVQCIYSNNTSNVSIKNMAVTTTLRSSWFPEIYTKILQLHSLKYLCIAACDHLTMHDIGAINETCNLVSIQLLFVSIYNSNYTPATIEDVVTSFCKVKKFDLICENTTYTPNTMKMLLNLPKNVQFKFFRLTAATDNVDVADFCIFLKKYAAPNCIFAIDFLPTLRAYGSEFWRNVAKFLMNWSPKIEAPYPYLCLPF